MGLTTNEIGSIAPVFVARALTEAGDPLIRKAWNYISGWSALERAGVPAKLRRELLSPRLIAAETDAIKAVRKWSATGSRSILELIGDTGVGKSYAGAEWLLEQHRRGLGIRWVSCPSWSKLPLDRDPKREEDRSLVTLADEERRALDASAVVIDDLGSGHLSSFLLERIGTLMVERDAAERPTLALRNRDAAAAKPARAKSVETNTRVDEVEEPKRYLDARIRDRMRGGSGASITLPAARSRRAPAVEADDIDRLGRGNSWRAAASVIETVGCVDQRDGTTWSRDSTAATLDPAFGWRLERTIAGHDWIELAEHARSLLRADAGEVLRIADALAQQDETFQSLGIVSTFVTDLGRKVEAERRGTVISIGRRFEVDQPEKIKIRSTRPELEPGERLQLAARGIKVLYSPTTREFEVRFKPAGYEAHKEASAVERKLGKVVAIADTENDGWAFARDFLTHPVRVEDVG